MIELIEIERHYGERRVLGPLSLQLDPGSARPVRVVGLAGLNGAGKTTTLRILAGDLAPTSGRVVIFGREMSEDPDGARALVGFAPDTPPLHDEMTVERFLGFVARLRGVEANTVRERVDETASRTGLSGQLGARIATLSHGFRKRLGIAQALVHRPRLVLLDEPTSGLDPAQISDTRDVLRALGDDDVMLVVSSHLLAELQQICDRVLVLHEGRVADDLDAGGAVDAGTLEAILVGLASGAPATPGGP